MELVQNNFFEEILPFVTEVWHEGGTSQDFRDKLNYGYHVKIQLPFNLLLDESVYSKYLDNVQISIPHNGYKTLSAIIIDRDFAIFLANHRK